MTRLTLVGLAWTALLPQLVGCAAQSNDQTKRINELNEQVRRLQATTDHLQERMSALENQRARESERVSRQVPATTPGVPDLPVVKMTPDSSAGSSSDVPATGGDNEEPRPLIVGEGSRIETRSSGDAVTPPRRPKDKAGDPSNRRPSASPSESGKK